MQALSERQENTSDHALIAEQSRIEDALVRITKKKADLTHDISDIKENKDLIKQKTDQLSQALSQRRLEERDLLNEKKFEQTNQSRLKAQLQQCQQDITNLESILSSHVSQDSIQQLPQWEEQLQDALQHKTASQERLIQLRFEIEDYEISD